jgi:hypothetical protein
LWLNPLFSRVPTLFKLFDVTLAPVHAFINSDGSEELSMKTIVKMLVVLGFGAALAGCVVAPYGHPRGYVVAPAPVVVVHPCCYR